MRLNEKVVAIVGAGQTPGETIGNGRAAAIRFAREGARLVLADRNVDSAEETRAMLKADGFDAMVVHADVNRESDCAGISAAAVEQHGQLDVLHYNVGRSEGDAEVAALDVEQWDEIMSMNLRGFYLCSKHALTVMRPKKSGVVLCISSAAALASGSNMTYKTSKAGMNALVQSMAINNGPYGIRVNAIMPGLMDTPMAIERRARERGVERDVIREERERSVPLLGKMGTAWDVASAAVFLASDEASYITGVALAVDGGVTARVG